ncbi:hypothetical protein BT63DRAFT_475324 [Microthyrium microscopicum]|uniref:Uncharacterized protein n=1 Tax=Microthyrium microscopicum TaxID=703497 RepID=A0A6A6UMH9_9PEZI|nr:hypothetical protein BT63DRAFT_475324 [Microthyrium microscopicum]
MAVRKQTRSHAVQRLMMKAHKIKTTEPAASSVDPNWDFFKICAELRFMIYDQCDGKTIRNLRNTNHRMRDEVNNECFTNRYFSVKSQNLAVYAPYARCNNAWGQSNELIERLEAKDEIDGRHLSINQPCHKHGFDLGFARKVTKLLLRRPPSAGFAQPPFSKLRKLFPSLKEMVVKDIYLQSISHGPFLRRDVRYLVDNNECIEDGDVAETELEEILSEATGLTPMATPWYDVLACLHARLDSCAYQRTADNALRTKKQFKKMANSYLFRPIEFGAEGQAFVNERQKQAKVFQAKSEEIRESIIDRSESPDGQFMKTLQSQLEDACFIDANGKPIDGFEKNPAIEAYPTAYRLLQIVKGKRLCGKFQKSHYRWMEEALRPAILTYLSSTLRLVNKLSSLSNPKEAPSSSSLQLPTPPQHSQHNIGIPSSSIQSSSPFNSPTQQSPTPGKQEKAQKKHSPTLS